MSATPTSAELNTAAIAERVAWVLFLAVALRLVIFHRLSALFVVMLAVGCLSYAYSVYRRRSS